MSAPITDLTVHLYGDVAVLQWHEDGFGFTSPALPTDEVYELANLVAGRQGTSYAVRNGTKTVAVCVPADTRYVSPTQTVYLVLHPVYETHAAFLTKAEAEAYRVQECKDAREAYADVAREDVTDYERDNARAYYVDTRTLDELDVPHVVRLSGRDAVLEYLNGGM